MRKQLNKLVEIELPSIPNYIRTKDGRSVIAVREFSKKELEEIGKEWLAGLIKKSKK